VTTTQRLDLGSTAANTVQSGDDGNAQAAGGGSGGSVPLVGVGVALVALLVVGFVVVYRRNQ